MGTIPFALSVSHFINSVGADAGFAAIIGLAILVLLYFAQARETASLRERSAESAEHVQRLELRLAQLSRASAASAQGTAPAPVPPPTGLQRTVPAPAPAPAAAAAAAASAPVPSRTTAAPAASQPSRVAVPSAPAGVGAPALSSATRLIPSAEDGPISIRATGAAAAAGVAAAGATGAAASGASPATTAGTSAGTEGRDAGAAVMSPPAPAPATAAGGANGGSGNRIPAPAPAPAPAPSSVRSNQPPRPPARPAGSRPAAAAPRRPAGTSAPRSMVSLAIMVIGGLLGLALIAVVLVLVLGSGGTSSSSSSSVASSSRTATGRHKKAAHAGPLTPASVTVVVLNGTSTPNLAHSISQRLAGAGYKAGKTGNATDQTLTATQVGYLAGDRRDALLVARSLKLGSASVQPVDPSNQAVACPQSSPCTAQVVVALGSDLASSTT